MIKRAYLIKLKPDAPSKEVEALVRTLEDAPQYVSSMRWSKVSRERSPYDWDLVWDHALDDEHGYVAYCHHPYHCNRIDDYLNRESPLAVVERANCFRWDDTEEWNVDTGPVLSEQEIDEDDSAYVLEYVSVRPGMADEYLVAVEQDYLPLATERGLRLVGSWRTPEGTGEEELVFLWSVRGLPDYHRIRVLFNYDEPRFSQWIERIERLRVGGKRRVLLPTRLSPILHSSNSAEDTSAPLTS